MMERERGREREVRRRKKKRNGLRCGSGGRRLHRQLRCERKSEERQRRSWHLFKLFARHGSGHLGSTNPAAKERKTRKEEKRGREWGEGEGGVMGNRGGELNRGWIVQRNGEKRLFLSQENDQPLFYLMKWNNNPAQNRIQNYC